ncbi:minor tail protein [Rhodococcus phage Trogglehumper]|uniref:Minor tail protein n=1 Tax=Rhodococcus phage Trogglehumper TaxID=3038381 RepID=A0AAF0K2Q8_9CAUD|nr:minor tail protein [Rhodococcus phage Trogglehumper]
MGTFPIGLPTKTLTFGRYSGVLGSNRAGTVRFGFDKPMLHVPTGEVVVAGDEAVSILGETGAVQVVVPVTVTDDLVADWDTANPITNQRLKVSILMPGYPPKTQYIDIHPDDLPVMDFDTLSPYATPGGLPALRAAVTSVAGLGGDISAEDLVAALDLPEGGGGGISLTDVASAANDPENAQLGRLAPASLVKAFAPGTSLAATSANTQRAMSKLMLGVEDVVILVPTDSTGNEVTEHVYLEAVDLAARFPAYTVKFVSWDVPVADGLSGTDYLAPVTVQTGTGTQTLTIYNLSIPGSSPGHLLANSRWGAGISAIPEPDLIMIAHGHNMGSVDTVSSRFGFRNTLMSFTEEISREFPNAGIVLTSQNPTFVAGREKWSAIKARLIQEVAAQRGYGYIDVLSAFLATGNPAAYVDGTDLLHPTKTGPFNGSRLWADTVGAALRYDPRAGASSQRKSALTEPARSLIENGDFAAWSGAAPDGWTVVNGTVTKDVTNFESGSYGLRLVGGAGAGSSHIEKVINPATMGIKGLVSGQYVTARVRVRVPAGAGGVAALTLLDQTGSAGQVRNDVPSASTDRFVWLFATKRMTAPTTSVTVRMACRVTGATGGDLTIDQVDLVPGVMPNAGISGSPGPKGDTGSPSAGQWDGLYTFGDHPAAFAFAASAGCGVVTANQANLIRVKPHRNMTIAQMLWIVHTTGGNYDVGIYAIDGTRLWSKGSTPTPAAGLVTETISPAVSLVAGTEYFVAWAADATVQLARGALAGNGDIMRSLTGVPFQVAASAGFPLPATIVPGASAGSRIAAIALRES